MKVLSMEANLLTGVIPDGLYGLTAMEVLTLGDNQLHGSIPEQISKLTALQQLALGIHRMEEVATTLVAPFHLGFQD